MQAIPLKIDLQKAGRDTRLWYRSRILLGLAESLMTQGILQPLVIRAKSGYENKYGVVAGVKGTPVVISQQRELVIAQDRP